MIGSTRISDFRFQALGDGVTIDPSDFGWVPGVLDMAAAQATIDAALSTGQAVQFSSGSYLLDVTGPARDVDGSPFYENSLVDRALYATTVGADLSLLGAVGGTTFSMVSQNTTSAILFAENLGSLTVDGITFDGNRTEVTDSTATLGAYGVGTTSIENSTFLNGGAVRVGSSDTQRGLVFSHGNNHYEDVQARFAVGIKHWGVEHVVETGTNTFEFAGGGATYDGDPVWYPGRPQLDALTANGTDVTATYGEAHGLSAGDWIEIRGADDVYFNGRFEVLEVIDDVTLRVQTTHAPAQVNATGRLDATFAWPATDRIEIKEIITDNMSSVGQVNAVKLEDGARYVTIDTIVAQNHDATNFKATAVYIGAGTANLGFETIKAGLISGTNLNDVVHIGLGSNDIDKIVIDRLEGDFVGSLLKVHIIDPDYDGGHGIIKELHINEIVAGTLDSPFNDRGSLFDIGNRFGTSGLIDKLFLGSIEVGSALQELFRLAPGAVNNIIGSGADDVFSGSEGDETLRGSGGNDELTGLGGDDILEGGAGDDVLIGNEGNDILRGKGDEDTLLAGAGNDELRGGKGDDQLFGKSGDDALFGDRGVDLLDGGGGNDILQGGAGNDTFVFKGNQGADVVVDYVLGKDKLDVSDWSVASSLQDVIDNHAFVDGDSTLYLANTEGAADRLTLTGLTLADATGLELLF